MSCNKNTTLITCFLFYFQEQPWFAAKEGYTFMHSVEPEKRVRGTKPPPHKEDCEIIMLCGLPGAGKTYWSTKYAQEHPEKRFNVLGTNNIIDKMKVRLTLHVCESE